ncbi:hypothetical protein ACSQ67_013227 [Phaseolus vulgaris]
MHPSSTKSRSTPPATTPFFSNASTTNRHLIHQSHLFHIAFPNAKILDSRNGLLCLHNNIALSIINLATRQIR